MRIRSLALWGGCCFALGAAVACEAAPDPVVGTLVVNVLQGSPPTPAFGAIVTVGPPYLATTTSGTSTFSLPPGTYSVWAGWMAFCGPSTSASVVDGLTTTITMFMGIGCSTADRISTGGTEGFFGLIDIRVGTSSDPNPCSNDLVVEGAGTIDLSKNALALNDPSTSCHGAAWIFTDGHAPWFSNTTAALPWTNAIGDRLTATLPPRRLRVPVTFWIADPLLNATEARDKLNAKLAATEAFLQSQRTGLRFTDSEGSDASPDIVDIGTLTDATGSHPYPGIGCEHAPDIIRSSDGYRADRINVYVVESLGGAYGINCREAGAANVIFMINNADYATIPHEIGHGLGLTRPQWGHAQQLEGMHEGNIMWKGIDLTSPAPLHMSLGQVARMHIDSESWLNETTGVGTVRTRQPEMSLAPATACSCPGDAPTDDCPAFQADIVRTSGPSTAQVNPACYITTDVDCLDVAVGETKRITGRGYTNAGLTIPGWGGGKAYSLTPSIASVIMGAGPFAVGVMYVDVTGKTIGDGEALIGWGGNLIKVPVKVGSACPP